jgi:ATP-binding cassette, subfamily B, bacterial PglK
MEWVVTLPYFLPGSRPQSVPEDTLHSSIQRFFILIEPGTRRRWVGVIVFAVLVSVMEAFGAVLVYGLIALTSDIQSGLELPVIGDLQDVFVGVAEDSVVVVTAVGVAVFFAVRAIVVLSQRYYQAWTARTAGVDLSVRLFRRYLGMPYSFHLRRNSSELIRNANEAVAEIIGSVLLPGVRLMSESFMVVAMFLVLIATAPVATLAAVSVLTPLVLFALWVVQPRMKRLGLVSQQQAAHSYQALQQGLEGYRDITVLGRQDFFVQIFQSARKKIARSQYRRAVLSEFPKVTIEAAVIVFIAGFIVASTLSGEGARRSLPVLGLFAYASLRILPALNSIISSLTSIRFGRAAVDDIVSDLVLPLPAITPSVEPLEFKEEMRLTDVVFAYEGTDKPTLQNLDLVIRRGDSIGIVGATGAGKSTLIDLIVGLSAPTSGEITVDGVDLQGNEAAWQRNIGLVSQRVFLLDDTLRNNIAIGIPPDEIDESLVEEAVSLAQLKEFVATLPAGLDTLVGERGVRVSGGQQQRVAIARALYRRPKVLVFDEGTSALDNLTEAALVDAVSRLRESHTIITVAHRLTTVQGHDRIVFMREGRIDDIGRFDELSSRNEEFRRLSRLPGDR